MRYTESDLSSAILDEGVPSALAQKVVICTSPRSGSFLLCRHMISARLGIPHEYFNPIHVSAIAGRCGLTNLKTPETMKNDEALLRRYMDLLIARRTIDGVFAVKLQFWQYAMYLDNPIGHEILNDARFMHLYREDLLGQAISLHFARLTGRWGFGEEITTSPAQNPNFFDPDAIDREIATIAAEDASWRRVFARNDIKPFKLSYERLCSSQRRTIKEVAKWITGTDIGSLALSRDEFKYKDVLNNIPSKEDIRKKYLQSRGTLRQRSELE